MNRNIAMRITIIIRYFSPALADWNYYGNDTFYGKTETNNFNYFINNSTYDFYKEEVYETKDRLVKTLENE